MRRQETFATIERGRRQTPRSKRAACAMRPRDSSDFSCRQRGTKKLRRHLIETRGAPRSEMTITYIYQYVNSDFGLDAARLFRRRIERITAPEVVVNQFWRISRLRARRDPRTAAVDANLAIQPRSDSRARTRDVHPFAAGRGLRLAQRRRSNGRSADLAGAPHRRRRRWAGLDDARGMGLPSARRRSRRLQS